MKHVLLLTALLGATAHASSTYNAENQRAVVLSSQGETIVVRVCEKVTADELRPPSEATLTAKCTQLSGALDLGAVERNLPRIKEKQIADIKAQKEAFYKDLGLDEDGHKAVESIVGPRYQTLIAAIDALTPKSYFEALMAQARASDVDQEETSEGLDETIDALKQLGQP